MKAERWKLVLNELEQEAEALKSYANFAESAAEEAREKAKEATRQWNKCEAAACAIHELLAAITSNTEGGAK